MVQSAQPGPWQAQGSVRAVEEAVECRGQTLGVQTLALPLSTCVA